jgi:hypothetical protein
MVGVKTKKLNVFILSTFFSVLTSVASWEKEGTAITIATSTIKIFFIIIRLIAVKNIKRTMLSYTNLLI